ncbi:MAG TPA: poly-gamma-glutamate hydrolase family protein [Burkholderiales bacterium]|nr:poly-gamma-glutamate hydrolase family protein [Burkholderiales bacterium]
MSCPDATSYSGFADLAKHQAKGTDYRIVALPREHSRIAVVAPHGGGIERRTSDIARAMAGQDFNLYLFDGLRPADNYRCLHLCSHRFDEPKCLGLISRCQAVVAIHGCGGSEEKVLLGGLDVSLRDRIASALRDANVRAETEGIPSLA